MSKANVSSEQLQAWMVSLEEAGLTLIEAREAISAVVEVRIGRAFDDENAKRLDAKYDALRQTRTERLDDSTLLVSPSRVEHGTERKTCLATCKECGAGLMLVQGSPFEHICKGKAR